MHRVMTIYGTRPEAIKMAPLIGALRDHGDLEPVVAVKRGHPVPVCGVRTALLTVLAHRPTCRGAPARSPRPTRPACNSTMAAAAGRGSPLGSGDAHDGQGVTTSRALGTRTGQSPQYVAERRGCGGEGRWAWASMAE